MNTQHTGKHAEELANQYLQKHGLKYITRNYHCRFGEIDLIMLDGDCIVFVEVRFRSRTDFGGGRESVDFRKQRKLVLSATHYLQHHRLESQVARIDVVAINSLDGDGENSIEWIANAVEG